jgi:hypothetical protein
MPPSIVDALTRALSDPSPVCGWPAALETVTAEFDERVLMDRYARLIERRRGHADDSQLAYAESSAASAGLLVILFILAGAPWRRGIRQVLFALALGTIFETLMISVCTRRRFAPWRRQIAGHRDSAPHLDQACVGDRRVRGACGHRDHSRPQWDVRLACYLVGGSLVLRSTC